jgi:hypothetical protein
MVAQMRSGRGERGYEACVNLCMCGGGGEDLREIRDQ